jgi:bifunctional non-homologous end joining protein LigD
VSARASVAVDVAGRRLALTNLDKVFYPATGFTKRDVIDYYTRAAPALLPHLRDRPLTLKRYPDGAAGPFFYEKRCPSHRPSWVKTAEVWSERSQGAIRFCVVNDLPSLVWAVNLADLEMHTYLHRAPDVETPTAVVFDLDPGAPADVVHCCEVALLLRRLFDRLGLASYAKASGSKGLQLYLPLNTRKANVGYDATKAFARAAADLLEAERPDLVVSSMKKALRPGKVLVDWSQNDAHKTTVCAWSLRARERPTVSAPVAWSELESALRARDPARLSFDAAAALARLEREGDRFAPVLTVRQQLPPPDALRRALGSAGRQKLRGAGGGLPRGAAPPPAARDDLRRPRHGSKSAIEEGRRQGPSSRRRSARRVDRRPAARRRGRPSGTRHDAGSDGYLSTE